MNFKNKVFVGVMFSVCIVIVCSILERERTIGIDVAFYSGIVMGALILEIMYCLEK